MHNLGCGGEQLPVGGGQTDACDVYASWHTAAIGGGEVPLVIKHAGPCGGGDGAYQRATDVEDVDGGRRDVVG